MSKFFADVINYFQRKVYCIVAPCLILLQCLQAGSLSIVYLNCIGQACMFELLCFDQGKK